MQRQGLAQMKIEWQRKKGGPRAFQAGRDRPDLLFKGR